MRLLPLTLQLPRRTSRRHRAALSILLLFAGVLWLFGLVPTPGGGGSAPSERSYTLLLASYSSAVHAVSFMPPSTPLEMDGKLGILRANIVGERPSWVCLHPTLPDRAYGVLERANGRTGRLAALRLGGPSWWRRRGHISVVDEVSSGGQDPCVGVSAQPVASELSSELTLTPSWLPSPLQRSLRRHPGRSSPSCCQLWLRQRHLPATRTSGPL